MGRSVMMVNTTTGTEVQLKVGTEPESESEVQGLPEHPAAGCCSWERCLAAMYYLTMAAMDFMPIYDTTTDIILAVLFITHDHPWWAALTILFLLFNWRFSMIFAAIHPRPTYLTVICMYIPGLLFIRYSAMMANDPSSLDDFKSNREQRTARRQRIRLIVAPVAWQG